MTAALILTGAPGSGKSSVLEALSTLLEVDEVSFGALEAEQLAWGLRLLSGCLSAVISLTASRRPEAVPRGGDH